MTLENATGAAVRELASYRRAAEANDRLWPEGLCLCGCGEKTRKAKGYEGGLSPGEHYRYVRGHKARHEAALKRESQGSRDGAIALGSGQWVLVDAEDAEWLSRWSWRAVRRGGRTYAARNATVAEREAGGSSTVYMHREILGLRRARSPEVDHRNRDGLDNRRRNLRIATRSQNSANRPGRGVTSSYKGVYWAKWANRWRVRVAPMGGGERHVGYFEDEVAAARAYDAAAKQEYGQFAWLNFPEEA